MTELPGKPSPASERTGDLKYAIKWVIAIGLTVLAVATWIHVETHPQSELYPPGSYSFSAGSLHGDRNLFDGVHWIVVSERKELPDPIKSSLVTAMQRGTHGVHSYRSLADFSADRALWSEVGLQRSMFGVVLIGSATEALARLPEAPVSLILIDPKSPAPKERLQIPINFSVIFLDSESPGETQRSWAEYAALHKGEVKRTTLSALPAEFENTLASFREGRPPSREEIIAYLKSQGMNIPEAK